ncbi:MAG: hypothetical protein ACI9WU_002685, partial [Myxococcota bacterium]
MAVVTVVALEPAERLGEIRVPSGALLLVDGGLMALWAHDREPLLPVGVLASEEQQDDVNTGADYVIGGPDAREAGLAWDRSAHPLFLFDVPRSQGTAEIARFAAFAAEHDFDAALSRLPNRISHRARIARHLQDGHPGSGVSFHGIWAAVVAGLPADRSLEVWGCRRTGPEFSGRWHEISIEVRPGTPVERSESRGWIAVDEARVLLGDVDAIGHWQHEESSDGLMDLVFWGRDAGRAAAALGAPDLSDTEHGWCNIPLAEGHALATRLQSLMEEHEWRFAADLRPHSDHWQAAERARASATGSGVVDVADARMCLFFTSWGDGLFEVLADIDANDQLVRIRIVLGSERTLQRMAQLENQYYGELSKLAVVSRRVLEPGTRVGWMFRR